MILSIILDILIFIVSFIVSFVTQLTPEFNMSPEMLNIIPQFLSICNQAKNFCHFIIGNAFYTIVDLIVALIGFKLVVYPIILLIRRNTTNKA